jgi:hypothetical protein
MLRENNVIGTIHVNRATPGPFTDKQVALLKTFADQAVIAIENVRLFKELQARNAEITEALQQQTATAEILKVIGSSPTDLQPVFDAILEKAMQLCESHLGTVCDIRRGKESARCGARGQCRCREMGSRQRTVSALPRGCVVKDSARWATHSDRGLEGVVRLPKPSSIPNPAG